MKCCRKLSTWGPRRLLGRNASPGADATDTDTVVTGYTFITSRAHTVSRFLAVLSGTSSSLLMLCLLRKRRSSLLISLPFSPFISAPFSLLFRQPSHICFLPFFYERARLAPYELTHVRPSPGDWAAGWAQRTKRHARFESSEALAELPAVARTAVELHGCCASW